MPFRSKETLEGWLAEYTEIGRGPVGGFEVLRQDGFDGADTGLMVVRLRHAATDVYMQPVAPGDPRWEVAFGARPNEFSLDTEGVLGLANELVAAASLCIFLERKSQEHINTH
jgi:hypothetical protein